MRSIPLSRRPWLTLAATVVLLTTALTAGLLFAANGPEPRDVSGLPSPVEPLDDRMSSQPDDTREQVNLPPVTKEPPKYPNLDSNLHQLAETSETIRKSDAADSGAAADPVLVTFYVEADHLDDMRQYLEDNGIFVRNVGDDYIEAHVPPSMLAVASGQEGVVGVDTVIPPRPSQGQPKAISQGVGLHGADAWHNAGYRGGVKVGVIDYGFENFRRLMGGELPRNVMARCYFKTAKAPSSQIVDCEVDGEHGTAVAETLVDVAPDAQLYIANPRSFGDLRHAVDWMAGQGVTVINLSLGYAPDGPGDGTSPFSNSPLRTIDAAVSSGITWVTAAGNVARTSWYGRFSDTDGDGSHNFTPRDEGNTFAVNEGDLVTLFLRWDDAWGGADCDLDLALLTRDPGTGNNVLVGLDDRIQDGSVGSYPVSLLNFEEATASQAGQYFLAIFKNTCVDEPDWIQLIAWIGDDLEYYSGGYHMGNPEESRNTGAMAVGATHWWDTQTIASYSSRGPTLDGRTKPDITGVACGRSTVIPPTTSTDGSISCWFAGTSQSAPHVAGLASLVKQRFPNYQPTRVTKYLMTNAAERGAAGEDNTWGHGLAALPDPSIVPSASPTSNIAVRDGANRGEAIISWDAVPEAAYYRIGYVNMDTDYPIAKASATGEWIEAFVYVDVNALNFTANGGRVEYTVRRLAPARHAFAVLTSNDVVNTAEYSSGRYNWPRNPRWRFHTVGQ